MIRAIFEKKFLEEIKRIDNSIELTKYIIGTKYNNISPKEEGVISNLFSGVYLNSDTRKIGEYPLYSIWDNSLKTLKINLSISESEREKLVEPSSEYDFIYCYGVYPSGEEKIAIILLGINESGDKFEKLDLNISGNIIELHFPEFTNSTILTTLESDTKFLEGIGVISGNNIFTYSKEESTILEPLVAKKSYYKYIRNNKTGGDSIALLYNNILGEKVYSNSYRKIYKGITLKSLESTSELSKSGGNVILLGEVTFDIYKVINDYNYQLVSSDSKCSIISIQGIEIVVSDNTGIDLTIDSINKKIIYKKNNKKKDLSAKVKLRLMSINISTKESLILESSEILLIQKH